MIIYLISLDNVSQGGFSYQWSYSLTIYECDYVFSYVVMGN